MLEKNYERQKEVFNEYFKESLIFHIPHSSTFIPFHLGYDMSMIEREKLLLTDWNTDEIFDVKDTKRLVTPFSRIFCDVERFDDSEEEMFKVGRGFYYTHTDSGEFLRNPRHDIKTLIKHKYYNQHHRLLENMVQETLDENGFVTIIDCHSFSNIPFKTDAVQTLDRPDVCLGTDGFHTPTWLLHLVKNSFENEGLSVKINNPYSGTIVPKKFYGINSLVSSIMIELNRDLYMDGNTVLPLNVENLNRIISAIF